MKRVGKKIRFSDKDIGVFCISLFLIISVFMIVGSIYMVVGAQTTTPSPTSTTTANTFNVDDPNTWIAQNPLTTPQVTEITNRLGDPNFQMSSIVNSMSPENSKKLYTLMYKYFGKSPINNFFNKIDDTHKLSFWNSVPDISFSDSSKGSWKNAFNLFSGENQKKLLTAMNSETNLENKNKYFVDFYSSLKSKDEPYDDDGKKALTSLSASLNSPGMKSVRSAFAVAVSQSQIEKDSAGKARYKGLTEFKINSKDTGSEIGFEIGFDQTTGHLNLMNNGRKILDISEAQVFANKINVNEKNELSLSTTDGKTLKFLRSDFKNLDNDGIQFDISKTKKIDGKDIPNKDFGNIKINGLSFNPYYGNKAGTFDVKILDTQPKSVTISSKDDGEWVRAGNNLYTQNAEKKGEFSVTLKNVGDGDTPNQVNSGKNVDVHLILEKDYTPYDDKGDPKDPSNVRSVAFRTQSDKEVAFLDVDKEAPKDLTGYVRTKDSLFQTLTKGIGADSSKDRTIYTYTASININGVDGLSILGTDSLKGTPQVSSSSTPATPTTPATYSGATLTDFIIEKSSNVEIARFDSTSTGNYLRKLQVQSTSQRSVRFQALSYSDTDKGILVNPSSSSSASASERLKTIIGSLTGTSSSTTSSTTTTGTTPSTTQTGQPGSGTTSGTGSNPNIGNSPKDSTDFYTSSTESIPGFSVKYATDKKLIRDISDSENKEIIVKVSSPANCGNCRTQESSFTYISLAQARAYGYSNSGYTGNFLLNLHYVDGKIRACEPGGVCYSN